MSFASLPSLTITSRLVEREYIAADTTGRISIANFDGSDIEEYLAGSTAVNVSITDPGVYATPAIATTT